MSDTTGNLGDPGVGLLAGVGGDFPCQVCLRDAMGHQDDVASGPSAGIQRTGVGDTADPIMMMDS